MDYFNKEWWKGKIIHREVADHKVYFFNEEGVYTGIDVYKEDANIDLVNLCNEYRTYYWFEVKANLAQIPFLLEEHIIRATIALEIGDTVEEFIANIKKLKAFYEENDKGIYNTVYRRDYEKYYFFNSKGIYSCLEEKEMLKSGVYVKIEKSKKWKGYCYCEYRIGELRKYLKNKYSCDIFAKAFRKLKIGDRLEMLDEYCNEVIKEKERNKLTPLCRFVTRIYKPDFVCIPENQHKDTTFDYIHVDVNLVTQWDTDKREFIKENAREINKMVLESIKNNRSFKKYGVPVNVLTIAKITLKKDLNSLHYVFQLKRVE